MIHQIEFRQISVYHVGTSQLCLVCFCFTLQTDINILSCRSLNFVIHSHEASHLQRSIMKGNFVRKDAQSCTTRIHDPFTINLQKG